MGSEQENTKTEGKVIETDEPLREWLEWSEGREKPRWYWRVGSWNVLWWPFPIADMTSSSSAVALGWKVYGDDDKPWIVKPVHGFFHKLQDWKYWLYHRFHPKHRYNVVKTGLKPGYYDHDTRMLHACMRCLEDYIQEMGGEEKIRKFNFALRANPGEHEPEGMSDNQADRQEEALTIYRWWKYERPVDQKRSDELTSKLFGGESWETKEVKTDSGHTLFEIVQPERSEEWSKLYEELRALDKKIEQDEDDYLVRLMRIRRTLWV